MARAVLARRVSKVSTTVSAAQATRTMATSATQASCTGAQVLDTTQFGNDMAGVTGE